MANKRVIDLAELSQTVQEGQYILVDSAGGTGKMDLKQIIDDIAVDPEGVYPDLIAGDLDTDKHQTDSVPYLFRPSASVGTRAYETIVGASVGWNQLVQSGATSVTVQSGHKYYAKINGTESLGASTGSAITINDSAKDMVIDLTQMLGSAIADYVYSLGSNGIAKLREWGFCTGYVPYDAGSIESVEVTGKKVVGFNQWDEEWEEGTFRDSTGEPMPSTINLRSKNFIPIMPNTTYYGLITPNMWMTRFFYDEDYNFLAPLQTSMNGTFVTPSNARYMRFRTQSERYPLPYHNDICINLSSDRNGEYEPYHSQSYSLGSDTLRGIFKLDANNNLYADGDVKSADGTITRKYGVVDLGTLTWGEFGSTDTVTQYYTTNLDALAKPFGEAISDVGYYSLSIVANTIYITQPSGMTYIRTEKDKYASPAAFKTAMSGHYLVYELATPTTETSTPFTSPQTVYPDGTEEFITENGVPVGHSTDYPYSIKALAEELIDIPDVPTANGTYVLKATRSASGIAYAWVTG